MKTIETNRIILRGWALNDVDDFFEYAKNPNVGPNAGWGPHTDKQISLNILNSFIEKNEVWAIVYKENGKVIGSVGLHDDDRRKGNMENIKMLGYVLSEDYWGKGIMTETVNAVLKFAFEDMNLELVSVFHYPFNSRSKRVIEKCGFAYEGRLRMASKIFDGSVCDSLCYSMTRKEYFELGSEKA